ncbi:D-Ala-D-Ala carboxypeptidase family metallohydrolase [Candidatus Dojkabacteria bacterium]|jgi:hypothetical protein|nr:D-Ala-D-Ala carboxypeptidase family metallohydrolase [Candidatus Dojkabacteria bacterium]
MNNKNITQTGFLYELRPTDYITGASPLIIPDVMPSADWRDFLPSGEKQYKYATFDTFSCTTFSFLNEIETWVNWHKANNHFSQKQIETMNSLGYFADGKFNCSDRFTAITSGTMPNGNYFQNVGDAVRKVGLLPEVLLPFGGNNQTEYLDKTKITPAMYETAKKILDILEISYEWTPVIDIPKTLKQCPIWCAIPEQATHAVMIPEATQYFDSYEPYLKSLPVVKYAMKVIVKVKPETKSWKYFKLTEWTNSQHTHTVAELKTELVDLLDKMRGECGFPFIITSGFRTKTENNSLINAVKDSAHTKGESVDIAITDSTKRMKIISSAFMNGIKRVGISPTFIHLDISKTLPSGVIWLY